MTLTIRRKITLGVVIGSRAFFSPAPCREARTEVLAHLERLGVGVLSCRSKRRRTGRCSPSRMRNCTRATFATMPKTSTVW